MAESFTTHKQLPLVGRTRELAILLNQFEASLSSGLKIILLPGEPGIGKTRLLDELATHTKEAGATVLVGGASQDEGMPPYLPFLETLGGYIETCPLPALETQTAYLAPTLVTILPELAARLQIAPQTYQLPPEQARFRLFKAVGDFLHNISRYTPLVLLLDDLQWADTASLDLLGHVARYHQNASILLVGTYRETGLKDNPALDRTVFQLNRLHLPVTLPLKPFSEAAVNDLAAQFLGMALSSEVCAQLYTQSEGNPFFAEELLRQWLEEDRLVNTGEQWGFNATLGGETALPASIASLIDQHLTRLDEKVIAVLQVAAIVGRAFEVSFLANVLGDEPEAIEGKLLAAVNAGLVRPSDPNWYLFSHDKIREGIYAQVSSFRRRRLHGYIGRELELQGDLENARTCENLAYHFVRSGDRQKGAHYAWLAGEKALAACALTGAIAHFRSALDLLDPTDSRLAEWLFKLGETERLNSQDHAALATFHRAFAHFKTTGEKLGQARACYELGRTYWRLEDLKPAQQFLQQALDLLESLVEAGEWLVGVLVELGSLVAMSLNRQSEGLVYAYRALELTRHLAIPRLEAAACRVVGNLLARTNKIREALPLLENGLELARRENDLVEASECCACLSLVYFWTANFHQFMEILQLRAALAEQSQDTFQLRHVYSWQSLGEIMRGRLDAGEQLLNKTQKVVDKLESPEPKAFLMQGFAYINLFRGNYAEALELTEQSIAIFREVVPDNLCWYLGMLAYFRHRSGQDEAGVLAVLEEVESLLEPIDPASLVIADALTKIVPVALDRDDRDRVRKYYAMLLPFSGLYVDALVDRILAEMEIYLGDFPAAIRHLEAAETVAVIQGIMMEAAFSKVARYKLLLRLGNSEEARQNLTQAVKLFEDNGIKGEAALYRSLLTISKEENVPAKTAFPAGLSPREVNVLRLVAAGLSNRQIAQELSLSEKTVANHLTGIFNKTSCDNRAAATAFALRHGIAR